VRESNAASEEVQELDNRRQDRLRELKELALSKAEAGVLHRHAEFLRLRDSVRESEEEVDVLKKKVQELGAARDTANVIEEQMKMHKSVNGSLTAERRLAAHRDASLIHDVNMLLAAMTGDRPIPVVLSSEVSAMEVELGRASTRVRRALDASVGPDGQPERPSMRARLDTWQRRNSDLAAEGRGRHPIDEQIGQARRENPGEAVAPTERKDKAEEVQEIQRNTFDPLELAQEKVATLRTECQNLARTIKATQGGQVRVGDQRMPISRARVVLAAKQGKLKEAQALYRELPREYVALRAANQILRLHEAACRGASAGRFPCRCSASRWR